MLTFVSTLSFFTLIAVMIVPRLFAMASPRARLHAQFVAAVSTVAICVPGALFLVATHWWMMR
ncbi:hypothetical protein [Cupriavidus numazuensis]|uniref:Uncharacterized protein n=1 Tax=Cupriavidus numazuensis TaxID=221992 RepID=A0ABM8TV48_9BURK|nr:hypothetical protein [Cupriavidus numazuensis]CAG2160493.1 hypothetical protein LMG26411_07522 [Cupriavidus numazuensis]